MKPVLLAIALLAMPITTTSGCSCRDYIFVGIVVDGQGIGIDDAQIVLFPQDEPPPPFITAQKTNSDGTFEARWSCTRKIKFFMMTVSKPGYDDDNRIVSADEENIRVVLSHSSKASE